MVFSVTFLGLCGVFALALYKFIVFPAFLSPLSTIPNAHPLAAVSTAWLKRQQTKRREMKKICAAHKTHGPIIRLSINQVSVASPEGLRQVYTAGLEKDPWYQDEFTNFGTLNLVSMLDHRSHSIQKRAIANIYSKSYVQSSPELKKLSSSIISKRFLPLLESVARQKTGFNVVEMMQWAGMDLTTAYLFGMQHGTNFLQDTAARKQYFGDFICTRDMTPTMKAKIEEKCMSLCHAALENEQPSGDVDSVQSAPIVFSKLYTHLTATKSDDALKQTASELLDHLVASHETTGIAMTYAMYRLSKDPALQTHLRKELITLDPPLVPESGKSLPSSSSIEQLPLLNSILLETLRLHAPAPGRLPRIVPKGGIMLHGHSLPAGTIVSSNAYTLHRNEEVFPAPYEWKPSRWLTSPKDEESRLAMRRWFWAFGSGGRMCMFSLGMI